MLHPRRRPKTHHISHNPLSPLQVLTCDGITLVIVLMLAEVPRPVSALPSLFRVRRWNERKLAIGISLDRALPLAKNNNTY